ncbi:MAG TPA: type II secretion system protein N [Allosphingosinicella sp.]|nr:type II secretion system protein N [Allosphingosinicella sp.]
MRISLDSRAQLLLRRVSRTNMYTGLELLLLSLLAIQCARLAWTIVTPVGPIGNWRPDGALRPAAPAGLLGSFDPFFRISGQSGPVVVTSLNLKLYGIRQDQASGRGSAIIATPDGLQRSFAVGEEIVPGVTLTSVDFDSVTISRGGTAEQLFMDQSPTAEVIAPGPPTAPGIAPPGGVQVPTTSTAVPAAPPSNFVGDIAFQPRVTGDSITGLMVAPQGSGEGFRALGLKPGDVVVSVNGRRINSAERAGSIASDLAGARRATVQVERDGRMVTLRLENGR